LGEIAVMNKFLITERVEKIAENATKDAGLELVHVEIGGTGRKPTVRIFIDKPDGVTLEDCSLVSQRVGKILDEEDFIPSAYTLEVSSPGLERGLYNLKDFQKFAGEMAKVKTNEAIGGQKNFSGKITGVEGQDIIFEDKINGTVTIPYNIVTKANLQIDFEEELKASKKRKMESEN
jgi:ribosome maturation factor RimP